MVVRRPSLRHYCLSPCFTHGQLATPLQYHYYGIKVRENSDGIAKVAQGRTCNPPQRKTKELKEEVCNVPM